MQETLRATKSSKLRLDYAPQSSGGTIMAGPPWISARQPYLDVLWDKLEATTELSTSNLVMDHLDEIARLCEEAAAIARQD